MDACLKNNTKKNKTKRKKKEKKNLFCPFVNGRLSMEEKCDDLKTTVENFGLCQEQTRK